MKKYKSKISVIIVVALFIVNMCMITIPTYAVSDPQYAFSGTNATITKQSVSVYYSPYSFTPSNDTISQGQQIIIIERDNNHYYIEYKKSTEGFTRTGYILRSDVSVSGSVPWCNYNIFTPGNIVSTSDVRAYFGPHVSHYMCVTTLPTLLGDKIVNGSVNDSRPLLVLKSYMHPKTNQEFYMVQYVANHTELTNTVQPYYIRCWVPKSTVALDVQTGESYFPNENYTLIANVTSSNYNTVKKYLTAVQNTVGEWVVELREATGDTNQQWKVIRFDYGDSDFMGSTNNLNKGGVYYKIISKAVPEKCLQLTSSIPQMGTNIILADITDYPIYYGMPNKGQEFDLDPIVTGQNKEGLSGPDFNYNGYTVGKLYRIRSRASGCYGCISVSGNGVVHSRVAATWVGNWSFERLDKYWSRGYDQHAGITGTKYFTYYVCDDGSSGDVDNVGISRDKVIEAVNRWNNIRVNGQDCVDIYTVSENNAAIKIYATDIGTSAVSKFIPKIDMGLVEVTDSNVNSTWNGGEIRFNTNNGNNSFKLVGRKYSINVNTNEQTVEPIINHPAKLGVVCHEFGHALKLKHPYGEDENNYSGQLIYSVMNQGVYTKEDRLSIFGVDSPLMVKYSPTAYDRQTLINKWNGVVE